MNTTTRTSIASLPDWSAVPGNSEEDRAFLNARLATFGNVHFWLSVGFLVLNVAITSAYLGRRVFPAIITSVSVGTHVLAFLIAGTQWLLCRKGRRTPRQLNLIDAGGLVLMVACYAGNALGKPTKTMEPVMASTLAALAVTVIRAIIVPGTARRTLWITTAACTPIVALAYYVASRVVDMPPSMARIAVFYTVQWCGVAVAIATVASRVIYGLQQRVRDAAEIGQYTLEEKIGEGGMGIVYRARHALLRRPTAIKLLPRDRTGAQNLVRFEREVQQTSRLAHPNTVAIYDYGHTADGVFYYAMEYLDGVSLEELVVHDGPQPPGRVVQLLRQVCGALAEAHTAGLIHRDIKPANLHVSVRGGIPDHVKVLDFGLVKEVAPADDAPVLSTTSNFVGTPLYMAPEAISRPEAVDARADLYALGAVAHFLLTGRPPFEGATVVEVCSKHLHMPPDPPSRRAPTPVPAAIDALVLKCLAKSAADRFASASDLQHALVAASTQAPWTDTDADRWWRDRGPSILDRATTARRKHGMSSGARTVAVDVQQRA